MADLGGITGLLSAVVQRSVEVQQNAVNDDAEENRTTTETAGTTESAGTSRVESEVPLSEMFGYATDLRSMTQGTAEFTMEFARYLPAPAEVQKELKEKFSSKIVDDE